MRGKHVLFAAVVLAFMLASGAAMADPPMDDDGGGCTRQPCLSPPSYPGSSNTELGQAEENWKVSKFLVGDNGGYVALAPMRSPFRLMLKVIRIHYGI